MTNHYRMRTATLILISLFAVACTRTEAPIVTDTHGDSARAADAAGAPGRLATDVRALAERFVPRDAAHPANLRAAADFIAARFKAAGIATEQQEFRAEGATYSNVSARLGPAGAARLVIGAHYDAAGPHPGADDNASGVAGLLEVALRLRDTPLRLRVDLVAFCLEEPPFFGSDAMGSAVYARALKQAGTRVHGIIALEMIGYFTDAKGSQQFPDPAMKAIYPNEGNFIAVVGRPQETDFVRRLQAAMRAASPLPVHSLNAPAATPGVALSDHASFWAAGYPGVMITDTAFFRNPNYHSATDTPATLDYARMAQVVDGVFAAIVAEAGAK